MRRVSGNGGGGAPRARTVPVNVPATQTGLLATVSAFGLLAPVAFAKSSGSGNLTLDGSNGGISATAALGNGITQSIAGSATGADGCVIPWVYNLTGISRPAKPTITLTPSNGQISVAWVDGATNGAPITAHTIYINGVALPQINGASPYVLQGLPNGVAVSVRVSATNIAGEGELSAAAIVTPIAQPSNALLLGGDFLLLGGDYLTIGV